jgi:hypothetical protein
MHIVSRLRRLRPLTTTSHGPRPQHALSLCASSRIVPAVSPHPAIFLSLCCLAVPAARAFEVPRDPVTGLVHSEEMSASQKGRHHHGQVHHHLSVLAAPFRLVICFDPLGSPAKRQAKKPVRSVNASGARGLPSGQRGPRGAGQHPAVPVGGHEPIVQRRRGGPAQKELLPDQRGLDHPSTGGSTESQVNGFSSIIKSYLN